MPCRRNGLAAMQADFGFAGGDVWGDAWPMGRRIRCQKLLLAGIQLVAAHAVYVGLGPPSRRGPLVDASKPVAAAATLGPQTRAEGDIDRSRD